MHLDNQELALAELCRVLRPQGRLVVSANNLLSPFAIPMVGLSLLKSQVRQVFKPPWFYLGDLKKRGIEVRRMNGDTVLALGLTVPVLGFSLLPELVFPVLKFPDRWVEQAPLNFFAYETWFFGIKARNSGEI